MIEERTLTNLRKSLKGRIYVWFDSQETCKRFLQDAENEGYRFGKIKPTQSDGDSIIALGKSQLSYVGFVGHVGFGCGGSDPNLHRIDYRKYINGDEDYTYKSVNSMPKKTKFSGKFYESGTIIGNNGEAAAEYLKNNLAKCENEEEEDNLYDITSEKFDVLVMDDEDEDEFE